MASNLLKTSKKLVSAINTKGYKLTISTKQFIGTEGRPHTMYGVNNAIWDDEKHKYINRELYSSTSLVRIVLYLRDMWFRENGWELPTDQEKWNQIREEIEAKKNG
jgi:hypothetical protein